ncbi:MAG: hypothetical protein ACLQKA_19485 [Bryobacteraceae bacterium]
MIEDLLRPQHLLVILAIVLSLAAPAVAVAAVVFAIDRQRRRMQRSPGH